MGSRVTFRPDSITEDIETEPLVGPSNGVSRPGPSTDVMSKDDYVHIKDDNDNIEKQVGGKTGFEIGKFDQKVSL